MILGHLSSPVGTGLMAESTRVLRQRRCHAEKCGRLFWICRSCDRGQRYCSPLCRRRQRLQQCRAANRRHQQSPEGRADHRDRQRAYRRRQRRARVTYQGRQSKRSSVTLCVARRELSVAGKSTVREREERHVGRFCDLGSPSRPICVRCGRPGRFIDPFHWG